jgi:protein TonB
VAYRAHISNYERGRAFAAVVAIHAILLFVFLHLSGRMELAGPQSVIQAFDLTERPPPPPVRRQHVASKEKEGASAPPNIKSEATPVQAPDPVLVVPPLPQISASPTPRSGNAMTQGASDLRGTGTGAGGTGNGSGSGGEGNGSGSGGSDDVADAPHLVTNVLRGRDFPASTLDQWPHGATVFLRLRIDPRGYVSECAVDRGSGVPAIDSVVCNLAHDRLRFRPAHNHRGEAVAGWFGYAQRAPR